MGSCGVRLKRSQLWWEERPVGARSRSYDTDSVKASFPRPRAAPRTGPARGFVADLELAVIIGSFEARTGRASDLAAVLAKYVVLTRRHLRCRNVDLVASSARPGRLVVIEKWESADDARAHLDAPETVEMATAARDVLADAPDLDLYESISAQDLE
jgi:quinol monooxygenase YgiN